MNKIIKKLIDQLNIDYKIELEHQKKFFSKPDVLIALKNSAIIFLNKLLNDNKKEIQDSLRKNINTKNILKFTSQQVKDNNIDNLTSSCNKNIEQLNQQLPNNIEISNFLSYIDKNNNINETIDLNNLSNIYLDFKSNIEKYETFKNLLSYIIINIKEILNTEFPSSFRTKYIQNLIRNTYGLLKLNINKEDISIEEESLKKNLTSILDSLKQLDNILIGISLLSSIYLNNRAKLQLLSKNVINSLYTDIYKIDIPEAKDSSLNVIPFTTDLSVSDVIEDDLVPHEPINVKLQNINCNIQNLEQENNIEISNTNDIATYAIIKNNTSDILKPLITIGSDIQQTTKIATLGNKIIYSPINGIVENIELNQFIFKDIYDYEENLLDTQIKLLQEKYENLNNIKAFLKNHYISTIYPNMLATSITDDVSTKNINNDIKNEFNNILSKYNKLNDDYNKNIKNITGKDNVEKNAKNETLNIIKDDIENLNNIFYKNLQLLGNFAINSSKSISTKNKEYELFEYYEYDILSKLNSIENPTKIEEDFISIINDFTIKNFILYNHNKNDIENKINELIKNIEKGISTSNYFKKALDIYNTNKKIDDIKKWLLGIANNNNNLDINEKNIEVGRIIFLFKFYLDIDNIIKKYNINKNNTNVKEEVIREGNIISNFTDNLWKQLKDINKDINNILSYINNINTFSTYSISKWNGYPARLYTIAQETKYKSSEIDDNINPKSKYGLDNIEYWMKYCSYATLASVANPATGWSTGIIVPNPILLPIVYIPIKSIVTTYGFIVIGISICGTWVFPWVLFSNLSTNYNIPIGDPTTLLKKEINVIKKEISNITKNFKENIIKNLLNELKIKIDNKNNEIKYKKLEIENHKINKPKKIEKPAKNNLLNGVKHNVNYITEYESWLENKGVLLEQLLSIKGELYVLILKYKIINEVYKENKKLKKGEIKELESVQNMINNKENNLTLLLDKLDNIIAALPISMKPESTNFGITLKNTKPIIKISDNLNDNINKNELNIITDKFKLNNKNLMSNNITNDLNVSIINYKKYTQLLSISNILLKTKDPFPKYELLNVTNIPWIKFLYNDFVTMGAKTYGYPGFPPI
ncbi:hypothetical protein M0Q50_09805 [bacterium]|jgi:hypothetical protein|nr:hypothetical protein [bacterium]